MYRERWLLPEGIEELLPPQARLLERLRRDLLDLFHGWGYDLVLPPAIEYLESLLTGTGHDLDLRTFKLIDQLSGRLLGIPADMTPQVARMDAHRLRQEGPTRLCYLGSVLHTRPDGPGGSRSPLQIGAELFGHAGVESDLEILRLMLATLERAGIRDLYLDLGHVGIYRGLARQAGLTSEQEWELFEAMQRKAVDEIASMLERFEVAGVAARLLNGLAGLNGEDALERAQAVLVGAAPEVLAALSHLSRLATRLREFLPRIPVHFDLAELRGYHYKTGMVCAAFVPGSGQEVARGGRYDAIGEVFGRARPAVGFSADLRRLLDLGAGCAEHYREVPAVLAPWSPDPALEESVTRLRAQGRRVITWLPGQPGDVADLGCGEVLVERAGQWQLEPMASGAEVSPRGL